MINNPDFLALRREYIEGAWERARVLRETMARAAAGEAIDLRQLRQEVHKLRGSGGFYGFKTITIAAGEAEDYLLGVLDDDQPLEQARLAQLIGEVATACEEAAREVGLPVE